MKKAAYFAAFKKLAMCPGLEYILNTKSGMFKHFGKHLPQNRSLFLYIVLYQLLIFALNNGAAAVCQYRQCIGDGS